MFITVPVDGWPTVIDAEASDARVSDELRGIPVRVGVNAYFGHYVREDCRQLPFNAAASYALSRACMRPTPVFGPAVIVGLDPIGSIIDLDPTDKKDDTVTYLTHAEPLDAQVADVIADWAREAIYAQRGLWDQLRESDRDPGGKTRRWLIPAAIDIIKAVGDTLPADYPDARFERVTLTGGADQSGDSPFVI
jgi:hypothetical protein